MMYLWRLSVVLAAVVIGSGGVRAAEDAIAELAREVEMRERFSDHQPSFHVEEQTFLSWNIPELADNPNPPKPQTMKVQVIKDGDRVLAVYNEPSAELMFITPNPDAAATELPERNRWTLVTQMGLRVTTVPYYYGWKRSGDETRTAFEGGGDTLVLREWQRWTRKHDAEATHTHRFSFDPVYGYVVDSTCEMTSSGKGDKIGKKYEMINLLPMNITSPMPDEWVYDYTVFSNDPDGDLVGWANNYAAVDRSDSGGLKLRDGGMIAFVPAAGSEHWGIGMTRHTTEGNVRHVNSTCRIWMDQHNEFLLPPPGDDGKIRVRIDYRLRFLPPELCAQIHQKMRLMDFGGGRRVMLRLGTTEDFEEQPLPLTAPVRGQPLTLSTEQAHSGTKSAVFDGANKRGKEKTHYLTVQRERVLPLNKGQTYRLEGWLKVEGEGTEACLGLDTWKHGEKVRTEWVRNGDWQQVGLTYTADYAHSTKLKVVVKGAGKAWLDDFRFVKIR